MKEFTYSIEQISALISEKSSLPFPNQVIHRLLTDSRKVTETKNTLFFVLKGRKNAHHYIKDLYHKGVRSFVYYDQGFDITNFPDANFLYSPDPLRALQNLAAVHRGKFSFPVIGITGSNGKTVVKEWLYQLLAYKYTIVRSPKSYNSQIGVPLSIWKMDTLYNLAIFEAGISQTGEMERLEKIIKPSIGVFTNIGSSHDEGFSDKEEKIAEKFKLFAHVNKLICNKEFSEYAPQSVDLYTWSLDDNTANLYVKEISVEDTGTSIKSTYEDREISIKIPFKDKASTENAITCLLVMLVFGYSESEIEDKMSKLHPVKMRLEMKSGINNTSIIDDSYNSDLSSLEIALDFLNHQQQHQNKTLILSDIQQSGLDGQQLYQTVARLLESKGVDKVIGIGEEISKHQNLFGSNSSFFSDTSNFLDKLDLSAFRDETILLKGARTFGFEKISSALSQQVHETILEINLNAMEHNLNYYRSKLKPGVKLMTMVKAFGYGSGSFEIANLLQFNHVDYLSVAYADEGVTLRQNGITLPIMVMSPEISSLEAIVKHQLEPEIFSQSTLEAFSNYLQNAGISNYPIHLKLDTGMHRLGFMPDELDFIADFIKTKNTVKIQSVFSHLVASESPIHDDFTRQQISIIKDFTNKLEQRIGYTFIKHICNTSAITRWPEAQFDMVRLGIGLYGVDNFSEDDENLEQVAVLKTTVSQIKQIKRGETIGYGRRGVMPEDGQIATVKIGYADGFLRALGNGVGSMFINGEEVFTIGNICMDMCMLNITGKNVKEGDEVIVFNSQKRLYKLAEKLNTIPYEILTSVSQRVKRVYYYE
ncbi:alanine racemase [Pseudopedobacter saltans DSM 12145]|uniref:Alanine racemase n=2 Tax=Pseudopedobacter saltans TaxID=151895 RepID=F0SAW0_PSESL|nr:alanine racemase [Pseudopedobacter saltans DSM 12145]